MLVDKERPWYCQEQQICLDKQLLGQWTHETSCSCCTSLKIYTITWHSQAFTSHLHHVPVKGPCVCSLMCVFSYACFG